MQRTLTAPGDNILQDRYVKEVELESGEDPMTVDDSKGPCFRP